MKRMLSIICVALLLAITVCIPVQGEMDSLEDDLLGTVSAQYESNGDPGLISSGSGDLGGASYGAYQFASTYDVPLAFANWCVSSGTDQSVGNRLLEAYETDENTFGETFNALWVQLAQEDNQGFLRLQRLYVKAKYYDPAVTALKTHFGLDINDYGIAFKNAVWSRTLQHGMGSYTNVTGFLGIMKRVADALPTGLMGCSEDQLILAVYEESGRVVDSGTNPMLAAEAGGNAWIIRQYELEGGYMKYFSGNSAAVQAGVYLRLRVNEPKKLMELFTMYGGYTGVANGLARPYADETGLMLSDCDTLTGFYADYTAALSVTEAQKQQGSGSLSVIPMEIGTATSLSLTFEPQVDLSSFGTLTFDFYLPVTQKGTNASLTVQLFVNNSLVDVGECSLGKLSKGWQTLSFDFIGDVSSTGIHITLNDLSDDLLGQRLLFDAIHVSSGSENTAFTKAVIAADGLYCRSDPSTYGTVYGMFLQDTTVVLLGEPYNGWYYCYGVDSEGETIVGWCNASYMRKLVGSHMIGDVNSDNKIDANDALLVLQYAVQKAELSQSQLTVGDVNGDGSVNAVDALQILKMAVNKL